MSDQGQTVRAFVGLGGNLGDVPACIARAIAAIDALPATRVMRVSSLYRNPPMGDPRQPHYVNAVAELATGLAAQTLLDALLSIEHAEGRTRGAGRWQSRTLDLDLLLYGDLRIDSPQLTIPHPGTCVRAFVIHPLAEIAPDAHVPGHGRAAGLASRVPADTMQRLDVAVAALR